MKKIPLALLLCLVNYCQIFSQVGIGTTTPDPSSILEINSQTQGLLLPRMTLTERNAIAAPAEGLFIYNLDSKCFQYYKGTAWSGCLGESPTNALGGSTYLDGSVNSGSWFYSIGSVNPWGGGIPSNSTAVNHVQLFIR